MLFLKFKKFFFLPIICYLLSVVFLGCVTVGPYVSNTEIEEARDDLKVKAVSFQIKYLNKVNNIGYRLLKNIPDEDRKGNFVFPGLLLASADKYLDKLYNLGQDKGVVVVGVIENGPAMLSGIKAGDLIKTIEGSSIYDLEDAAYVFNRKAPNQKIDLRVTRAGEPLIFNYVLGSKPLDISFRMVDEQEVNAGATPNLVVVTYGLMRFVQGDDEVAIVLGHELAHVARGHHLKGAGINILSTIFGAVAGLGANKVSPGSGDMVMRAISSALSARYSQDFEREADYFGLKYVYLSGYNIESGVDVWERFAIEIPESMTRNFFSTHPSSPERMVRLKKIVEELKSKQ